MQNLTEQQIKLLRWGGFALFSIANLIISFTGGMGSEQPIYKPLLSDGCKDYLANHSEYDLPPMNCEQELRYLVRRINATLRQIEENDRIHSDLVVPKND